MISTVEKTYKTALDGEVFTNLKVTYSNGEVWVINETPENRIYKEVQEWAKIEGNNIIDPGA
tara:strand:- start:136 stop:321 length:186 start_codon:yes stop_codon:yes gene_type:complete